MCKRRQRSLHAYFYRFKRTQERVREEFRGGGGTEVDDCFVGIREHFVAIEVLEDLVESVFAGALEGVAYECWGPAEENAAETFFGVDAAPSGEVGGVDFWVDLPTAFYLFEQMSAIKIRWWWVWGAWMVRSVRDREV